MRPKFADGELVILQSISSPESNGEYTVIRSEYGTWHIATQEKNWVGYRYFLDDGQETGWVETSLRKKHYPGELSFTDLMASLSSPKLLTHDKT